MNTLAGIFFTSFLVAFSGAIAPGPVLTVTISESIRRGFWAGPLIVLGHGILELFLFVAFVFGLGRFLTLPSIKGLIGISGGLTLVWFGGEMAIKSYQTQLSLADRSERQSAGEPERRSIDRPEEQSADRSERQSAGEPEGRFIDRPEGRSAGWPERRSADRPEGQSAGEPERRSDGRSEGRSPDRSERRSDGGPGGRSIGGPEVRSMHPILAGFFISMANPYWTIWWATIGLSYIALSLPFGWRGLALFYCGHILADLAWYSFISSIISLGKKSLSSKIYHLVIFLCGIFLLLFGLYFLYSGLRFIRK